MHYLINTIWTAIHRVWSAVSTSSRLIRPTLNNKVYRHTACNCRLPGELVQRQTDGSCRRWRSRPVTPWPYPTAGVPDGQTAVKSQTAICHQVTSITGYLYSFIPGFTARLTGATINDNDLQLDIRLTNVIRQQPAAVPATMHVRHALSAFLALLRWLQFVMPPPVSCCMSDRIFRKRRVIK